MGGKNTLCFMDKCYADCKTASHLFNISTLNTNYICRFSYYDEKLFQSFPCFYLLHVYYNFFLQLGFLCHQTATQLAVYKLPKHLRRFFFSNIDSVHCHSIRPDKRRSLIKMKAQNILLILKIMVRALCLLCRMI